MTLNPLSKSLFLLVALALTVLTAAPARAQYGGFSYPDYSSPSYWRHRETEQKVARDHSRHHKSRRTTVSHRRHTKSSSARKTSARRSTRRPR